MAASSKITVRLTENEARILRSQAIRSGLTISAFARQQILHGGSTDAAGAEKIVDQILPAVEARLDTLLDEIQAIKQEARHTEDRTTERLKKAVQIVAEEIRKK